MPKFVKHPTPVEANQFHAAQFPYPAGVEQFTNETADAVFYRVKTAGGYAEVFDGDWIITESDGSGHYPCRPDIFAKSYKRIG